VPLSDGRASGRPATIHVPPGILERARQRAPLHRAVLYNGRLDLPAFTCDFPTGSSICRLALFMDQRRFMPVLNEHRVLGAL
jgi:hypothetical protein